MNDSSELLNISLKRCSAHPRFTEIFYSHFLDASPEIKLLFKNTDLQHQMNMLEKSLRIIVSVSEQNWTSDQFLSKIAKHHKSMNIKPEHYKHWETSLLLAVAECDPEYDEQIKQAWKDILSRGINFMMQYP